MQKVILYFAIVSASLTSVGCVKSDSDAQPRPEAAQQILKLRG